MAELVNKLRVAAGRTPLVDTAVEDVEFVSEFLPAPLIDVMRRKGHLTWSVERDGSIHTFVARASSSTAG